MKGKGTHCLKKKQQKLRRKPSARAPCRKLMGRGGGSGQEKREDMSNHLSLTRMGKKKEERSKGLILNQKGGAKRKDKADPHTKPPNKKKRKSPRTTKIEEPQPHHTPPQDPENPTRNTKEEEITP